MIPVKLGFRGKGPPVSGEGWYLGAPRHICLHVGGAKDPMATDVLVDSLVYWEAFPRSRDYCGPN